MLGARPRTPPLDYAARLRKTGLEGELLIIMRAYLEKPRTATGWTGLLSDPGMDGGHDMHRGLREARRLLAGIAELGIPAACEWVSPVVPHYLADTVTWSAIGARTTESQAHRHLASSLECLAAAVHLRRSRRGESR